MATRTQINRKNKSLVGGGYEHLKINQKINAQIHENKIMSHLLENPNRLGRLKSSRGKLFIDGRRLFRNNMYPLTAQNKFWSLKG